MKVQMSVQKQILTDKDPPPEFLYAQSLWTLSTTEADSGQLWVG